MVCTHMCTCTYVCVKVRAHVRDFQPSLRPANNSRANRPFVGDIRDLVYLPQLTSLPVSCLTDTDLPNLTFLSNCAR